jgi:hypothetical protein
VLSAQIQGKNTGWRRKRGTAADGRRPALDIALLLQLELLVEDAFFEIVFGIEQQGHRLLARFVDADFDDITHFV